MTSYNVQFPLGSFVEFYTNGNKRIKGIVNSITISTYTNEYKIRVGKNCYNVTEDKLKFV